MMHALIPLLNYTCSVVSCIVMITFPFIQEPSAGCVDSLEEGV